MPWSVAKLCLQPSLSNTSPLPNRVVFSSWGDRLARLFATPLSHDFPPTFVLFVYRSNHLHPRLAWARMFRAAAGRALLSSFTKIFLMGFRCQVQKGRGQLAFFCLSFGCIRARKMALDGNLHKLLECKLAGIEWLTPLLRGLIGWRTA